MVLQYVNRSCLLYPSYLLLLRSPKMQQLLPKPNFKSGVKESLDNDHACKPSRGYASQSKLTVLIEDEPQNAFFDT